MIDGLNEYGIFSKIVFPLGKPAMATLVIFTFTNVWNDFMGPLIYLKTTELKTCLLYTSGTKSKRNIKIFHVVCKKILIQ